MKYNKLVAYSMLASIGITVLTGVFKDSLAYTTTESLYGLAGVGFIVFGIWAAVLLLKHKE